MKAAVRPDMEIWEALQKAETPAEREAVAARLLTGGYSVVYRLVDALRERIRAFADGEADGVLALIGKAKAVLPEPGNVSPAWQNVWNKLENMVRYKQQALETVPPEHRDGEWQVLVDNPFENRETACYPGMTFDDAVFVYAKLRPELVENEVIRLQKVVTHLTVTGADK